MRVLRGFVKRSFQGGQVRKPGKSADDADRRRGLAAFQPGHLPVIVDPANLSQTTGPVTVTVTWGAVDADRLGTRYQNVRKAIER